MSILLLATVMILAGAPEENSKKARPSSSPMANVKLAQGQAPAKPNDPRVEQARYRLRALRAGLTDTLSEALKKGPEEAVGLCRLEAPQIAASASDDQVTVGRTSHQVRNPRNKPAEWMKPYLAEFKDTKPEPGVFRAAVLADGSFGYVEPIYVQPMCLTCHGEKLTDSIRATLQKHYPKDRATGYKVGDFRGLFWVKIHSAAHRPGDAAPAGKP
jgi:hypothetical protein